MVLIFATGIGNVGSVKNALDFLGVKSLISNDRKNIRKADHIILPGVGGFGEGMKALSRSGAIETLKEEVLVKKKPFLGICLGMQLLADFGEEGGVNRGLGFINGRVRRINPGANLALPHIGWDDVIVKVNSVIFQGIDSPVFYFVHDFFLEAEDQTAVIATCQYGENISAAINKKNIYGVQFHPEKSQKSGLKLLRNFVTI